MPNIGTITAALELESAAFIRDLGKAAQSTERNTKAMADSFRNVERGFSVVGKTLGSLGLAFGGTQIATFTKQVMDSVGGLGEMADQMGITVESLQVYEAIAVQSGLKTEQLQNAVAYFTRTIGDAASGSDTAVNAFKRLGIGILDAGGKVRTTDDLLQDVAKRIAGIGDATEQAAAVADLFGAKSGSRLIPTLKELANGYGDAAEKARAMGLIVGDDVVNNLDKSADAIERHKITLRNWYAEIVSGAINAGDKFGEFVNGIDRYLQKLIDAEGRAAAMRERLRQQATNPAPSQTPEIGQEWADALRGGGVWNFGNMGGITPGRKPTAPGETSATSNPVTDSEQKRAEAAKKFLADLAAERDSVGKTRAEILGLKMSRETEMIATGKRTEAVRKYTDAQVAEAVAIQGQIDARDRLISKLQGEWAIRQELQSVAAEMVDLDKRRDDAIKRESDATQALVVQADAAGKSTVEWNKLTEAYEVNDRELRIVQETQRLMNEDWAIGADNARKYAEANINAQDNLKTAIQKSEAEARRQQATFDELANFSVRAFDRIGESVTRMFVEGKASALEFKNLMGAVISEIAQEFMKLAVLNPIKDAIFGTVSPNLAGVGGGLFGWLKGLGGGGGGDPSYGGQVVGGVTSMDGFADGGRPTPGMPSIVGERGKELFVPDAPGTVVPHLQSMDWLRQRGGDTTVIINAPPGSKVDSRESNGPGGKTIEVFIDETVAKLAGTPGTRTSRALATTYGATRQLQGR